MHGPDPRPTIASGIVEGEMSVFPEPLGALLRALSRAHRRGSDRAAAAPPTDAPDDDPSTQ